LGRPFFRWSKDAFPDDQERCVQILSLRLPLLFQRPDVNLIEPNGPVVAKKEEAVSFQFGAAIDEALPVVEANIDDVARHERLYVYIKN
jgi:hypothetical protein